MPNDSATQTGATATDQQDQQAQLETQLGASAGEGGGEGTGEGAGQGGGEGGGEGRTREPSPRELAMASIEAQRTASLREQGVLEDDGGKAAGTQELDTDTQLARQLEGGDQPLTLEAVKGRKFRHMVDGQEQEFSMEELVRRALKGEAADHRLEKATATLQEAQRLAEEIRAAGGGKAAAPAAKPEGGAGEDAPPEARATVEAALNKVLDGDPSGAADLLTQLIARQQAEVPPVERVVDETVARIQRQTVLAKFFTDYKDVTSDKRLGKMVDEEFGELIGGMGNAGQLTPEQFDQQLREAGNRVRKFVEGVRGGPANGGQGDDTPEARTRRKAELDPPLRSASTRVSSAEQAPPVDSSASRSSAIAEIAKARGQIG